MADWSGGLFDTKRNRFIIHGGGHNGWYGNEIYAIDFSANPIAPVLLKDASHGSAISNVGSCPETFSDGTPNARHTYNGLWYLPTQDTYFLYGAGLSPCGSFSDGQWQFSPNTGGWSHQTPSNHPDSQDNGSIPQFAYDSVTDSIYEVEANTGSFWQYTPANNTWTNLASVSACPTDNSTTVIDAGRRLYLCVGAGGFSTVSLNAPYTAKDVHAAAGCSALVGTNSPGFTYDPAQKLEVGWVSGNTAYTYNPDTNSCGAITQYTGGPTTVQATGTFGRFQYSPALGLFVVVNDISSNVYTLRLSPVANPAGLQDFQTRCAQPGVIVCQGFDSASVFTPATWPGSGLYPSDLTTYGTMDTSVYASGGGSLKFTIPSLEGSNAGYWRQLFAPTLSAGPTQAQVFGPSSTFYVQFRQRFSPEFLTNLWPQTGGGTTYWKQEIFSNDSGTCAQEELTTVNANLNGYPMMYSQCGQDLFQVPAGTGDYLNEQGAVPTDISYNCHYLTVNNVSGSCFMYPANTWVTFYYKVSIGQWGQANSSIQAWVALPGQSYKQWINMPNHVLNQDAGSPGYDMVTLLPYMTGRNASVSAGPTAYTWYDELIMSTQPIAPPTGP